MLIQSTRFVPEVTRSSLYVSIGETRVLFLARGFTSWN